MRVNRGHMQGQSCPRALMPGCPTAVSRRGVGRGCQPLGKLLDFPLDAKKRVVLLSKMEFEDFLPSDAF